MTARACIFWGAMPERTCYSRDADRAAECVWSALRSLTANYSGILGMGSTPVFTSQYPLPALRRLRVYAFDPQSAVELDTAVINDAVIELPWESRWEAPIAPGPVNDYLEVIDYDPASGRLYPPVDLDDPGLLAQNGLAPSEGRPQFHQQMVFAVAMRTIRTFERALGRVVLWAGDRDDYTGLDRRARPPEYNFTRRLRIYPHALREPNAYYSPVKRALLFGYFKRPASDGRDDSSWIFTCLSQDIVAHETTHAILHGMLQRSVEPSSPDTLAFHESFADMVALLQRFSMTDVVEHLLAASRGSLRQKGLLSGLALQFGQAIGNDGALRYALEMMQEEADQNSPRSIDAAVAKLAALTEPHARGGVLVAAVFDAFVTIYERRVADLLRLAGIVALGAGQPGSLSPDLVRRLASEAGKAADHVLRMCVRAMDYIPPVAMQFGEYLRAVVTADADLVPDDPLRYRVAFVEAFRKRGITVPGCISMAPDSLLWDAPEPEQFPRVVNGKPAIDPDYLSEKFADLLSKLQLRTSFVPAGTRSAGQLGAIGATANERRNGNLRTITMNIVSANQATIHTWFAEASDEDEAWEDLLGIRLLRHDDPNRKKPGKGKALPPLLSITATRKTGEPSFEVASARIARRQGPNGETLEQLVVQIIQRRRGYLRREDQALADAGEKAKLGAAWENPDFWFRGGSTLLVDLRDGTLRRIIRKRIDSDERLAEQRAFLGGDAKALAAGSGQTKVGEPFAMIHRSFS